MQKKKKKVSAGLKMEQTTLAQTITARQNDLQALAMMKKKERALKGKLVTHTGKGVTIQATSKEYLEYLKTTLLK